MWKTLYVELEICFFKRGIIVIMVKLCELSINTHLCCAQAPHYLVELPQQCQYTCHFHIYALTGKRHHII